MFRYRLLPHVVPAMCRNRAAQNKEQLETKARAHMRNLQNNRSKTKKFFEHRCVNYAA